MQREGRRVVVTGAAAISPLGQDWPRIHARLPEWYRTGLNAPSFLLLPLQLKGQTFALIYADQSVAGGIVVDDKALGLLRTLRNQAVMAFRQAG